MLYKDAQRAIELDLDMSGLEIDLLSSSLDFSVEGLACTQKPSSAPIDLSCTRAANAAATQAGNQTHKLAKVSFNPIDSSVGCLFCAVQSSTLRSLLSLTMN